MPLLPDQYFYCFVIPNSMLQLPLIIFILPYMGQQKIICKSYKYSLSTIGSSNIFEASGYSSRFIPRYSKNSSAKRPGNSASYFFIFVENP